MCGIHPHARDSSHAAYREARWVIEMQRRGWGMDDINYFFRDLREARRVCVPDAYVHRVIGC